MHFMKVFLRHFSNTSITTNNLPSLTKFIPFKRRSHAITQAQEVVTEYLHCSRSLPFTFAELIANNSTYSLYDIVSKVPFHSRHFRKNLQTFLRYHPINEFGFFFESIGIDYVNVSGCMKPNLHFLADDCGVFKAACCLYGFGFPWDKLGKLYVEEVSIFDKKVEFLIGRLDELVLLGFSHLQIVGICLSFPGLLKGDNVGLNSEFDALLSDLKRVFVGLDLDSSLNGNVDVWFEVCKKIKVFYGLGFAKGELGELFVKGKSILTDFSEEVLVEKVEFFSRLGIENVGVGMLILSNPEILSVKLGDCVISVSSLLDHFGLCKEKLEFVEQNYKHVIGRNKMVNLPNILRALDLYEWFRYRMKCGYHQLFAKYDLSGPDEAINDTYVQKLESLKSLRTYGYSVRKLDFFHGLGFGENRLSVKLLRYVHASPSVLQERFDFLLNEGIGFSKLCKMISRAPKMLNQDIDNLKKKIVYLVKESIGIDYGICLSFPALWKGDNVGVDSDFDAVLSDLKRVFVDLDLGNSLNGNVDVWFEVCKKIKVFYGLGFAKGELGELFVNGKSILTDFSEEVLVEKVEFFSRLGIENIEVGMLILSNPEILSVKLGDRVISVSSLLDHFGLCKEKLKFVEQNYKHVIGRNKMVNLPNILRALDLYEWFRYRMKCGYHQLFANYDLTGPDEAINDTYVQKLESLKSLTTTGYSVRKLDIFHRLGFGENRLSMKLLCYVHASPRDLQERFDFLLNEGIEFSKLCKMISRAPKMLNQDIDNLKKKIVYLVEEIGLPLDYLENFPFYLVYNLENRIKPRYEFHMWLIEQGLCTKKYTLATIVAVSHKTFWLQLSCIHPNAPQLWLERHGNKNQIEEFQESIQ